MSPSIHPAMSIHNRKSMISYNHPKNSNSIDATVAHQQSAVPVLTQAELHNKLLDAVKHNDTEQSVYCIDNYTAQIDLLTCVDNELSTVLHWCSWLNNTRLLHYILFSSQLHITSLHINSINNRGESVLEWAIRCNSVDIFNVLVEYDVIHHNINWHCINQASATLLHISVCEPNIQITQCLLVCGIDIDSIDIYGNSALHNAIQRQQHNQIKLLLQNNINTLFLSQHSTSVLHLAAQYGMIKLCNDLLKRGCTLYLNTYGTQYQMLPEQCAYQNGHTYLAKILRSARYQQYTWKQWLLSYVQSEQSLEHNTNGHSVIPATKKQHTNKPRTTLVQCYYFITLIGTMTHFWLSGTQSELLQFDPSIQLRVILLFMYITYIGAVVIMYRVSCISPGCATHNSAVHTSTHLMQAILNNEAVCITCRIVRPIRSKHDNYLNACILRYDHWCPWVNNVIGLYNHRLFICGLIVFNCVATLYIICGVYYIASLSSDTSFDSYRVLLVLILHAGAINLAVLILLISQLHGIMSNMTTNENINRNRYEYIFNNPQSPFDDGWWNNCLVFWNIKQQRVIDIKFITYLNDQVVGRKHYQKVFDQQKYSTLANDDGKHNDPTNEKHVDDMI